MVQVESGRGSDSLQVGALIPDFTARTVDGRTVHCRDFKGRKHLVLCLTDGLDAARRAALLDLLTTHAASWRATRGETLVFWRDTTPPTGEYPFTILKDEDGALHRRYSAADAPLLVVADCYGEMLLLLSATPEEHVLPVDRVLPALEWLEMRCSL